MEPDLLSKLEPLTVMRYVRVVPELALDKMFDYVLPSALVDKVQKGHRLKVPWGRKTVLAYAVEFPDKPQVANCREVIEMVGEEVFLPPVLIKLARWMADYYCCDFNQALRGMLPAVLRNKEDGFKLRYWVQAAAIGNDAAIDVLLKNAKVQRRAWEFLQKKGGGWMAELSRECGATQTVWRGLEDKGLVTISFERKERNPLKGDEKSDRPLILNEEQHAALQLVLAQVNSEKPKPIMMRGVTGSGKTEVYLQALAKVLKSGRSGLVLVPEISLTSQTVERFRRRFESMHTRIAVLHSHLSEGERHDQWQMIREGRARIVIGARSAIFAPLTSLGLIIVDEEHEHSYKQDEVPRYHARDLAIMRASMENIPVILGSATPSLETIYNVRQGKYLSAILNKRVENIKMPVIHVLDLRKEVKAKGQLPLISDILRGEIELRLQRKEQSIIFLNRRGYATSLNCPECGYVAECPRCSLPLTYHRQYQQIRCHLCDYSKPVPACCPDCGNRRYKYEGVGTQKIEDAVRKFFPQATIQRMDSDAMHRRGSYEEALRSFRDGETNIWVGTQMIAKGLHFPNVTLVGVVNCDAALQMSDFRASERVFQQIIQVAGRAGRGNKVGEVFIQTIRPYEATIQFARHYDIEGFYDSELNLRHEHRHPPYCRTVLICFRGPSEKRTSLSIEEAAKRLQNSQILRGMGIKIMEPTPAPFAKIGGHYRFHLLLMTNQMITLSRVIKEQVLSQEWPEDVRVTVDVDAVNLL